MKTHIHTSLQSTGNTSHNTSGMSQQLSNGGKAHQSVVVRGDCDSPVKKFWQGQGFTAKVRP